MGREAPKNGEVKSDSNESFTTLRDVALFLFIRLSILQKGYLITIQITTVAYSSCFVRTKYIGPCPDLNLLPHERGASKSRNIVIQTPSCENNCPN